MVTHFKRWLDQFDDKGKYELNPLTVLPKLSTYDECNRQLARLHKRALSFLSMLVQCITLGQVPLEFDLPAGGMRHPWHAGLMLALYGRLVRTTTLTSVRHWDWDQIKEMSTATGIPYATRKQALELLTYKAVYMPPGGLRTVFYMDEAPPPALSPERVSRNPHWRASKYR